LKKQLQEINKAALESIEQDKTSANYHLFKNTNVINQNTNGHGYINNCNNGYNNGNNNGDWNNRQYQGDIQPDLRNEAE